jgi:hypothetical protein
VDRSESSWVREVYKIEKNNEQYFW